MNEDARLGCVKEDLLRVRVDQEDRSDRLSEEERALKECVASLKGRVETLVKRERAYMGMEEVVEGRFEAMYARENESRAMMYRSWRFGRRRWWARHVVYKRNNEI